MDEMRKSMSHDEFIRWYAYHRRRAAQAKHEMEVAKASQEWKAAKQRGAR